MQTALADFIRDTPDGREADAILRSCVHCGFCTATCPTYQLLGDDLDSPRGRIYLIKEALEGSKVTAATRLHLDRCLTCRSCETTCPSGVRYGRLVDIGRRVVEERAPRSAWSRTLRWLIREGLLLRPLFGGALAIGRVLKPLMPEHLRTGIPDAHPTGAWPTSKHSRRMIVLDNCVQDAIAPGIDAAMARVLDRIGISLIRIKGGGCCGALPYHLSGEARGLAIARRNIDAWWPHVDRNVEAIVVTSSGCGVMVKDYGHLLRLDPDYAEKAAWISKVTRDTVEVIGAEWPRIAPKITMDSGPRKVAFQSPCSLQHGLKLDGRVEEILLALGLELTPVADPHLCCGSSGTYSLLQPELARQLKANKLAALEAGRPDLIATANIGCLAHLASGTKRPVQHWIELLDARMQGGVPAPS
ncbi:MAG: glycolate oxidase subunit GlcF [Betaproteobacteria bacterium]